MATGPEAAVIAHIREFFDSHEVEVVDFTRGPILQRVGLPSRESRTQPALQSLELRVGRVSAR